MQADAFRAMGSDALVYVVGGSPNLIDTARSRVGALEALWSRFVPTSEVSRLNATAGAGPRLVSPETFELIQRGVEAWRLTGGLFDPTILGDVLRAGYTVSFDELAATKPATGARGLRRGCHRIKLDAAIGSVSLPAGVGFDPGGIGKGLAADLLVGELLAAGADGACVNLGGDVRVAGVPPDGAWSVAIEHPTRDEPVAVVHLQDGAVATSSVLKRRWQTAAGSAHHLIDPRFGQPADAALWTATAIAANGWQAEAFTKAAFLSGPGDGLQFLEQIGAAALLIDNEGAVLTNRAFSDFADRARTPPIAVAT